VRWWQAAARSFERGARSPLFLLSLCRSRPRGGGCGPRPCGCRCAREREIASQRRRGARGAAATPGIRELAA
jgi:hypothetical protein